MKIINDSFKQLVNVKIELDGVEYKNTYAEDIDIDSTNLQEEFLEHSKRYAYYATLATTAEDRHQRRIEELTHLRAKIDVEIRIKRDAMIAQNPKFKMSEPMILNEILSDSRYQKKLMEMQAARQLSIILQAAPYAFSQRKDMLIALGKVSDGSMSSPRVQEGREQQVRNMFAARAVVSQPIIDIPVPDDLDATNLPPEGELVDFTPPEVAAPMNSRRRSPKTS